MPVPVRVKPVGSAVTLSLVLPPVSSWASSVRPEGAAGAAVSTVSQGRLPRVVDSGLALPAASVVRAKMPQPLAVPS